MSETLSNINLYFLKLSLRGIWSHSQKFFQIHVTPPPQNFRMFFHHFLFWTKENESETFILCPVTLLLMTFDPVSFTFLWSQLPGICILILYCRKNSLFARPNVNNCLKFKPHQMLFFFLHMQTDSNNSDLKRHSWEFWRFA
jgi:hypothetical protein